MLVLAVDEKTLTREREANDRLASRRPDSWSVLASRGRLRRLVGDRQGLDDIRRAAEISLGLPRPPSENGRLEIGYLFRLADDPRADEVLQGVYDDLTALARERGHSAVDTGILVDVCFLLGRDREAQEVYDALERADPKGMKGTRHKAVAQLAAARLTGDVAVAVADEAIAWFDRIIAKEKPSVADYGAPLLHDWLEMALILHSELTGEVSPRLREV